jgi:hypothetical protein
MKKTTLPKLKKKALDLFSELVKLHASHDGKLFCFTCNTPLKLNTSNCQLGHYLGRGCYPGLTFHPDNTRLQCYVCNCHKHGNTIEFRERLINEIGIGRVMNLELNRHQITKLGRSDYEIMITLFKDEINELRT